MSNTTLADRIKCAEHMAKYTGNYNIALEARLMAEAGDVVKAHKFLRRYGF